MSSFVETIEELANPHINLLKSEYGFPHECVLSSHLLCSYLKKAYPEVKIVYGTYGNEKFFHCWIEYKELIVDFTLFQFLAYKEKRKFYEGISPEGMLKYILEYQTTLVLDKNSRFYKSYHPLFYPIHCFETSGTTSYEEFLGKAQKEPIYYSLRWLGSRDSNGITFFTYLESNKKRVGKRHFTKCVIINK